MPYNEQEAKEVLKQKTLKNLAKRLNNYVQNKIDAEHLLEEGTKLVTIVENAIKAVEAVDYDNITLPKELESNLAVFNGHGEDDDLSYIPTSRGNGRPNRL